MGTTNSGQNWVTLTLSRCAPCLALIVVDQVAALCTVTGHQWTSHIGLLLCPLLALLVTHNSVSLGAILSHWSIAETICIISTIRITCSVSNIIALLHTTLNRISRITNAPALQLIALPSQATVLGALNICTRFDSAACWDLASLASCSIVQAKIPTRGTWSVFCPLNALQWTLEQVTNLVSGCAALRWNLYGFYVGISVVSISVVTPSIVVCVGRTLAHCRLLDCWSPRYLITTYLFYRRTTCIQFMLQKHKHTQCCHNCRQTSQLVGRGTREQPNPRRIVGADLLEAGAHVHVETEVG